MKKIGWVIVANSAQARIFKIEKGHKLTEVDSLINPEARLHDSDVYSDRPGRSIQSSSPSRSALQPKTSLHQQELNQFSKLICEKLAEHQKNGELGRLYIAAAPALLGVLRQHLSPSLKQLVEAEIDKDITHLKAMEIEEYLAL